MNQQFFFRNYNSWVSENKFRFGNLTNQRLIPEFINSMKRLIYKFGHKNILLDFKEVSSIHPLPIVPIAGYIHYFKNQGVRFEFINQSTYLVNTNIEEPLSPSNVKMHRNYLDKIWFFNNSDEIFKLNKGIAASLRKAIECEIGIIEACEWGLYEIMDNVLQHSEIKQGFIMAQIQKTARSINICIFDYGVGIYQTLRNTEFNPRTPIDAISIAIKEGVTRDKSVGQGNGMWGLYNMVNLNNGYLTIMSGKGGISFENKKTQTYKDIILLNNKNQATTVNIHLKINNAISMEKALGGRKFVNLFVEGLENDRGQIVYKFSENTSGTGTRESAESIRNELLNIYRQSKKTITLDFSDIGLISSSFADELIGKLILQLGFYQYQRIFNIINMNDTIQTILHRSIMQRFSQEYEDKYLNI